MGFLQPDPFKSIVIGLAAGVVFTVILLLLDLPEQVNGILMFCRWIAEVFTGHNEIGFLVVLLVNLLSWRLLFSLPVYRFLRRSRPTGSVLP